MNPTEQPHPSDPILLALVHAEQVPDRDALHAHIAGCDHCKAHIRRFTENDALIATLLGALDHSAPDPGAMPWREVSRTARWRRALTLAGPAAALAVAAAAMIIPVASPLHHWIVTGSAPRAPTQGVATQRAVASPPAEAPSGIAIPATPHLVVTFRQEQARGIIELTRADTGEIAFESRDGTPGYHVGAERVMIDNRMPADTYLIRIPAAVQQLRVMVGSRTLLRWPEDSARYRVAGSPSRLRVAFSASTGNVP